MTKIIETVNHCDIHVTRYGNTVETGLELNVVSCCGAVQF